MNPQGTALPLVDKIRGRALIVGVVGAALSLIGFVTDRAHFDRAYLFSFLFVLGWALGSMALLCIHRQLGGAWGFLIRRPLEAAAMTLPLVFVLFIPILVDLDRIYSWVNHRAETAVIEGGNPSNPTAIHSADKPEAEGSPVLVARGGAAPGSRGVKRDPLEKDTADLMAFKHWWLTPGRFTIRVAIYFAIWITIAAILNIGSRRQDETRSVKLAYNLQSFSAPALVVYFLTTSLALIDWGMSLEPEWYSSLYAVILIIGQGLSTISLMIIVTAILSRRGETDGLDTKETFNDLGNLLLAFTMLWGYLSFSQFLIIWSGNLAEEIPWYARRLTGDWKYVGMFLMLFHFAVPFLVLLARPLKRNINALWKIAALMAFMRLVDVYWLITPSFDWAIVHKAPEEVKAGSVQLLQSVSWLDVVVPATLIGIWLTGFLYLLRSKPLMVVQDPELLPALKQARGH